MDIEFIASSQEIHDNWPVVPAKKLVPDWYKNTKQETQLHPNGPIIPTIKQCPPVTDLLTSGYIIRNPFSLTLYPKDEPGGYTGINAQSHIQLQPDVHHWKMCPVNVSGKQHWTKINNGWTVKTAPGYSCLFMQPFFFFNKNITLFPGIVDTDKHDIPVQFPGYLHSDEPIIIEEGTPLIQIIPFKREEWKMQTSVNANIKEETKLADGRYKDIFQTKKKFQ